MLLASGGGGAAIYMAVHFRSILLYIGAICIDSFFTLNRSFVKYLPPLYGGSE